MTDKGKNLRQMAEQLKQASEALEKEALEEDAKVSLQVPPDDILDDFGFKVDLEIGSSSVYCLVGEPKTPRAEEFIASLDKFTSSMRELHGIHWAQKHHGFVDQWNSVLNQLRECSGILVTRDLKGRLKMSRWAKGLVLTVSNLPPSELLSVINNNPNWKFSNLPSALKTLQRQLDRARISVRDCERLKFSLEELHGIASTEVSEIKKLNTQLRVAESLLREHMHEDAYHSYVKREFWRELIEIEKEQKKETQ